MRIAIFGRPGAGKSTLALKLGKKLNIPVYHLDKYFFTANWQERPRDEFLTNQEKIVTGKDWIIDGNSLSSLGARYSVADVVIYLNLPMPICLFRVFKRILYNSNLEGRPENCPEKIDWKLIKYMWNFEQQAQSRGRLDSLIRSHPNVRFYNIRSDKEAEEWLSTLPL